MENTPSYSNEYYGKGHLIQPVVPCFTEDMQENIKEAEGDGYCRENSEPSEKGFGETTLGAQGTYYTESHSDLRNPKVRLLLREIAAH